MQDDDTTTTNNNTMASSTNKTSINTFSNDMNTNNEIIFPK